jgi:hypothetical protein
MRWRPGQSGNLRGRPKNRPVSITAHLKSLLGSDVGVVFEIVHGAEHKRRSRLLCDRWIAANMIVAAIEGDGAILKMILDRTEGRVKRASTQSRRVELHVNIPQRLEAARERAVAEDNSKQQRQPQRDVGGNSKS